MLRFSKTGYVTSEDYHDGLAEIGGARVLGRAFAAWIVNNVELEAQGIDSSRVSADKTPFQFSGVTS
jgi:hypothetical protein